MAKYLVTGGAGFIGSNLARQFAFDECYNSKNIGSIRGREFDLLVSAGVSAVEGYLQQIESGAQKDPVSDSVTTPSSNAQFTYSWK